MKITLGHNNLNFTRTVETKISKNQTDRRNFLTKCFATGSVLCMGCLGIAASAKNPSVMNELPQAGMSNEEVLRFALGYSVPVMKKMQAEIGNRKFIEVLKKSAAANMAEVVASMSKDIPVKDMKNFGDLVNSFLSSPPLAGGFKYEIIENTEKVFEVKFTECIMAKLYREMGAADLGYAIECSPSDAVVKAFNPNARAVGGKNMMKGDAYCNERWELT